MSKVVFVGNVPYNMGEEQLIDVFKSVGQVVGFRLVFDRETGKPRGYGFCEFADHETALSAVRNLNNVDVGGRPLRIDLADSDPFLEGKTTVRGELIDGGETRAQWRERENAKRDRDSDGGKDKTSFLRSLPQGVPVPPGASALDMISQTLATMNPAQLVEVLAQFKAFVITHPDQARGLLVAHPQLAYALFQALLLNKIVDPAILQVQQLFGLTSPHPAQSFRSLFSACLQPRIQAIQLVLPLRLLRPHPHRIWHRHLRLYRSSLKPACTHRTMGFHPRRSRHPSTLHKSQCTPHQHQHHSNSSNSNSSTCHIMVFHSSHPNPNPNRRLRQHQRLLSTTLTRRRRYLPILPPNVRAKRGICPRQCCSKSFVSHRSKLTSFHLRRGTLSSLSQVDPAIKHLFVTNKHPL
ncbi:hypothetical protein BJY52DRAFT_1266324 [Lactarius psammicola]|nr:hypothetical protein BJY52DRAFT_1266324 [Lactarius psammicola]